MDDPIWINRERSVERIWQVNSIPEPALRIEFYIIPSWNHFLAAISYPRAAQQMVKIWRKKGRVKAIDAARRAGWQIEEWIEHGVSNSGRATQTKHEIIRPTIFTEDVSIVLRFWRPNWIHYDVFSPFAKPIIDGFKDAGVLVDDNCERVPKFTTQFMGVDPSLKLSKEAQTARKVAKIGRKKNDPAPARYWFDFYA
jgi:hypothetical protein